MEVKQKLTDRKKLEETSAQEAKEYEKFSKATSEIRSAVYDTYREAVNFQRDVQQAKTMYQKYLKLADGAETVALRFFADAYKDKPELIEAVFPKEEVV
jgi:hypothetical protein